MGPIRCLVLNTEAEAAEVLESIGADAYGVRAMAPKMGHLNLLIKDLPCPTANIMKQEMLSLGGDVAVARGTVACSIEKTDALVMGTRKQVGRFAEKIEKQPFGLSAIAKEIARVLENIGKDAFRLETPRRTIELGKRTLVMGIINVTPDSFSDGGKLVDAGAAVRRGVEMEEEGADILDVGGESSRPGAMTVSEEEELRRVIPVVEGLAARVGIPISVDTAKAKVAKAALEAGAELVNDITALNGDDRMAEVAAELKASVVLMHMRGTPRTMQEGDLSYGDLFSEVIDYLAGSIRLALDAGIDPERIVVDPGIGFGKGLRDNIRLLRGLGEFKVLGRPILVGTSRKAFIGAVTGKDAAERLEGTAATVTAAILNGAHIVRVHDVGFMKRVAAMADAIARGSV
ncbi:MAG TPA: dihydropteroate synthase [Syntrophales bacterium]|nr:dihydropteroate synthase [Syntrophales bacterium]HRT27003.1 dihydropteroate synthase [Syntrophales bacterium]